jgi:hypothetical protein
VVYRADPSKCGGLVWGEQMIVQGTIRFLESPNPGEPIPKPEPDGDPAPSPHPNPPIKPAGFLRRGRRTC